jgi:hypothetical protein
MTIHSPKDLQEKSSKLPIAHEQYFITKETRSFHENLCRTGSRIDTIDRKDKIMPLA